MPTYDYRCGACGHEFEDFASMSAPALKKCPSCKKAALERLIGTGAAVLFKGSGFYQTDYRSEGYKKAAEAAKGDNAGGGGAASDSAKPDTTPAARAGEQKAAASEKPTPADKGAKKPEAAPAAPKASGSRPSGTKG